MLSTQLINGIRGYRREHGFSIRGYARWNPTFKTLAKFEAVIPPEFMVSANENDDGNGGGGCCARAGGRKSAAA